MTAAQITLAAGVIVIIIAQAACAKLALTPDRDD